MGSGGKKGTGGEEPAPSSRVRSTPRCTRSVLMTAVLLFVVAFGQLAFLYWWSSHYSNRQTQLLLSRQQGRGSSLRLAVGIVGQLSRFSFETFAANVLAPNIEAGNKTRVDVFAFLPNGGFDCRSGWNTEMFPNQVRKPDGTLAFKRNSVDWKTIERDFRALVEGAGGNLMGFETPPQVPVPPIQGPGRMTGPAAQLPGQNCAVAQQFWNRYQLHRMLQVNLRTSIN
ncbi:hypothetical protein T484DRAFT_2130035 [Baffinella frigidus]|nr:hypothetical protein T484DRAFT_2130035 [Cryptophyta sp. CCMP2293]